MNRPRHRPSRGTTAAAIALAALALAPLTLSAWRHARVPGLMDRAQRLPTTLGLRWFLPDVPDAAPRPEHWSRDLPQPVPTRAVLLVHGLDEPGGIWDSLAPAIAGTGRSVIRFDYPNDQPAARSADALADALWDLRLAGVESVDIVAHSMGGLVTRDSLTRPGFDREKRPAVPLLITVGTPHEGSPWAGWQPVAELREQIQRWAESDDLDPARLFTAWHDGFGEAGDDLRPGSPYLIDLNQRPDAAATRVVSIVGVLGPGTLPATTAELSDMASRVGDGVVPAASAAWPASAEILLVRGNHRSILRPVEIEAWARAQLGAAPSQQPPAIPLILDRLTPFP